MIHHLYGRGVGFSGPSGYTIWGGSSGLYPWGAFTGALGTGTALEVLGLSAGDNGIQVRVKGLDPAGVMQEKLFNLDGANATTPVAIGNWYRVYAVEIADPTATTGDVQVRTVSGSTVVAHCSSGTQAASQVTFTVPVNVSGGAIKQLAIVLANAGSGVDYFIRVRRPGEGFLRVIEFDTKTTEFSHDFATSGKTSYAGIGGFPLMPLSDIDLSVVDATGPVTAIIGTLIIET